LVKLILRVLKKVPPGGYAAVAMTIIEYFDLVYLGVGESKISSISKVSNMGDFGCGAPSSMAVCKMWGVYSGLAWLERGSWEPKVLRH
jgi:hypothetical protein